MRTNAIVSTCIALLAITITACGNDVAVAGTWNAERETRGDTVIVTTTSGSVWPGAAELVEEVRIGVLDGPDELIFGRIGEMAPDAHGGIYIFDGQAPALRYYDAAGNYVRTLGRSGAGPGEYEDAALGLAVRSDGRIVMRDARNSRINVYSPDGTPSNHWPVASGLFTSNAMVVDTADHMYLKILLEPPERNRPWRIGLLHLDDNGVFVDTIADPSIAGEPTDAGGAFLPSKRWALSPHGYMVVGVSSDYSFEVRYPDGRVTRVVRSYEPVQVLPEERAEYEAANDWMRENQGQFLTADIPDLPSIKPAYRSISAAADGRIWVQRHVQAEKRQPTVEPQEGRPPPRTWVEPTVYDVFEPDGTYLGEVRMPPRTSIHWIGRDHVWAVVRGDMDENYAVRLRIEPG